MVKDDTENFNSPRYYRLKEFMGSS